MIRPCVLGLLLAGSGSAATPADLAPIQSGLDYHSFANIEQFRVTRVELDLRVDSDARVLRGVVGLLVKRLDPGATQLILDTRDLTVSEVTEKAQGVLGAMSKTETTWVGRPFHFERKEKTPSWGRPWSSNFHPRTSRPSSFASNMKPHPPRPGCSGSPPGKPPGAGSPSCSPNPNPSGRAAGSRCRTLPRCG
jgi:hypothetical protein